MVLLYCGTMPTHKLAQDDREGDETHTAVDGLMIVGGSTCTRSGVCVSAASATDIGASKGHGLSCFRVCLVTVVRTQASQAQGVDCPVVDHRVGRRPGVSAEYMYRYLMDTACMRAINRLSQRRETYICMYISPGAVFPGVHARDARGDSDST